MDLKLKYSSRFLGSSWLLLLKLKFHCSFFTLERAKIIMITKGKRRRSSSRLYINKWRYFLRTEGSHRNTLHPFPSVETDNSSTTTKGSNGGRIEGKENRISMNVYPSQKRTAKTNQSWCETERGFSLYESPHITYIEKCKTGKTSERKKEKKARIISWYGPH